MKIQKKLSLIGSVAVMMTSPLAFAEKGGSEPLPVEEAATSEEAVEVVISEEPSDKDVSSEEEITFETTSEEVPDETVMDGGGGDTPTDGEVTVTEEPGVPIDWVKRGGEEGSPDMMFYNAAPEETVVFKDDTASVGKEIGQNEKGAELADRDNAAGPQVKRVVKGPVALIKKGRVFLK